MEPYIIDSLRLIDHDTPAIVVTVWAPSERQAEDRAGQELPEGDWQCVGIEQSPAYVRHSVFDVTFYAF